VKGDAFVFAMPEAPLGLGGAEARDGYQVEDHRVVDDPVDGDDRRQRALEDAHPVA